MPADLRASGATTGPAGALRVVRLLAAAGAALVFVVIVSSAYLRHQQSGLGCADRVACYRPPVAASQPLAAPGGATDDSGWSTAARRTHRISATAVTAAIAGIVLVGWAARPVPAGVMPPTLGLLVLATVLAVVGTTSMQSNLPVVTLVNLIGGMAMFALFARILGSATTEPPPESRAARLSRASPHASKSAAVPASVAPRAAGAAAGLLAALALVQITLGGLVSAQFAGFACGVDWLCREAAAAEWTIAEWSALAPATPPAGRAPAEAAAMAGLNLVHRIGGVCVVLATLIAAWRLHGVRTVGRAFVATAALALVQTVLGALNLAASLPLAGVLAHNAAAALMLFLVAWASARAVRATPAT